MSRPVGRARHSGGRKPLHLVKARGQEHLPKFLQFWIGREVHALTGSFFVPVLLLDDGTAINKPDEIVAWAQAHPVGQETAEQ